MIKLKSILGEGFAWERRADGSLPTIADTTAAYEAQVREQAELNMSFDSEDESAETEVEESAKPDFLDLDKDGDKEESMKSAAKSKKEDKEDDTEEVNESFLITRGGEQKMRQISLQERITKNLRRTE